MKRLTLALAITLLAQDGVAQDFHIPNPSAIQIGNGTTHGIMQGRTGPVCNFQGSSPFATPTGTVQIPAMNQLPEVNQLPVRNQLPGMTAERWSRTVPQTNRLVPATEQSIMTQPMPTTAQALVVESNVWRAQQKETENPQRQPNSGLNQKGLNQPVNPAVATFVDYFRRNWNGPGQFPFWWHPGAGENWQVEPRLTGHGATGQNDRVEAAGELEIRIQNSVVQSRLNGETQRWNNRSQRTTGWTNDEMFEGPQWEPNQTVVPQTGIAQQQPEWFDTETQTEQNDFPVVYPNETATNHREQSVQPQAGMNGLQHHGFENETRPGHLWTIEPGSETAGFVSPAGPQTGLRSEVQGFVDQTIRSTPQRSTGVAETATATAAAAGSVSAAAQSATPNTPSVARNRGSSARRQTTSTTSNRSREAGAPWWLCLIPLAWLPLLAWFGHRAFGGIGGRIREAEQQCEAGSQSAALAIAPAPAGVCANGESPVAVTGGSREQNHSTDSSSIAISESEIATGQIIEEVELPSTKAPSVELNATSFAGSELSDTVGIDAEIPTPEIQPADQRFEEAGYIGSQSKHRNRSEFELTQEEVLDVEYFDDELEGEQTNAQTYDVEFVSDRDSSLGIFRASETSETESVEEVSGVKRPGKSLSKDSLSGCGNSSTEFEKTSSCSQHSLDGQKSCQSNQRSRTDDRRADEAGYMVSEGRYGRDEWTSIQGIDQPTQQWLYSKGYFRFEDLASVEPDQLRTDLQQSGLKTEGLNCERLVRNATQLADLQSNGSREPRIHRDDETAISRLNPSRNDFAVQTASGVESGFDSDVLMAGGVAATGFVSATSNEKAGADDLTKIKGIGKATAGLLNQSGIRTFAELKSAGTTRLQQILEQGGSRFKLIDPTSWTTQAGFAVNSDWKGLTGWLALQTCDCDGRCDCGKRNATQLQQQAGQIEEGLPALTLGQTAYSSDTSGVQKIADDLTLVRGIGPATEKLLHRQGVQSLGQIAQMTGQQLIDLIAKADADFCPVDPLTWPLQANELVNSRGADSIDAELESNLISEIKEISQSAVESTKPAKKNRMSNQKS